MKDSIPESLLQRFKSMYSNSYMALHDNPVKIIDLKIKDIFYILGKYNDDYMKGYKTHYRIASITPFVDLFSNFTFVTECSERAIVEVELLLATFNEKNQNGESELDFRYSEAALGAALYLWRYTKRVYVIDESLLNEFRYFNLDSAIPAKILRQLPDYCVYIDISKLDYEDITGFFAHITYNSSLDRESLNIVFTSQDNPRLKASVPLPISDAITINGFLDELNVNKSQMTPQMTKITMIAINCLLYLCQPDVDYKGGVPKCYVRNRVKLGMKIEPAKKVTTVVVGEETGRKLVEARTFAEREYKEGKRKSPHLRRGHYHHYYVNDLENEGSKKLIVKWLSPIMVNGTI